VASQRWAGEQIRQPFCVHHSAFTACSSPFLAQAGLTLHMLTLLNFGEGFERDGNRELLSFFPSGSIGESRAQLIYALDLGYLKPETFSELDELGKTATKCLGGLIRHLNSSSFRGRKFKQRDGLPDEHGSSEGFQRMPDA
jgi:hypothetical protein